MKNKRTKKGVLFENVSLSYGGGKRELEEVNLFIPAGSFFGITGVNGSGKSTLIQLINGLIPQQIPAKLRGKVYVDGVSTIAKPVSFFASRIGMVFQNPDFMLFNLTVEEEILFGLKNLKAENQRVRISRALDEVGLRGYEKRDPQTLSLGQKQKVCLACILAADTPYIILDEPTAMLDHKSSLKLFAILKSLNMAGKTIIVVEHETDLLLNYADKMIVIDKGRVVAEGTPRGVFSKKEMLGEIGIKVPNLR